MVKWLAWMGFMLHPGPGALFVWGQPSFRKYIKPTDLACMGRDPGWHVQTGISVITRAGIQS